MKSDHHPLIISTRHNGDQIKKSIFLFEAMWLTHPKFGDFMKSNWNPSAEWVDTKNNFVHAVQQWNKDVFENFVQRKRRLFRRLHGIQRVLVNQDSCRLKELEARLILEYNTVLQQEEILWYQKSRSRWIKLGDRNTRYFHTTTIVKRRRNRISPIKSFRWFLGSR